MENKIDVNYQDDTRNQHILRLNNLDEKNSGEYEFRMKTDHYKRKSSHFSGVTLIVTGKYDEFLYVMVSHLNVLLLYSILNMFMLQNLSLSLEFLCLGRHTMSRLYVI